MTPTGFAPRASNISKALFYMVKPRFYPLLLLFIGAIAAAYYWSQPAVPEQADYYPAGRDINPFTLTDEDAQPFTPANLTGHWSFLFIGYTYCPDVCPTTLADLRSVYPALKKISLLQQLSVKDRQLIDIGDRYKQVGPDIAHFAFHIAFFVAGIRIAE